MHIDGFVRGKGRFMLTEYIATDERTGPRFPLLLTTGRILSQYNVGAQTVAPRMSCGTTRIAWRSTPTMPSSAGSRTEDWVKLSSRAGETSLRALITDRVAPGVVYTTFHHPNTQANVITTDFSDWATNCPEYKVTAVQVGRSNGPSEWQQKYDQQARNSRRISGLDGSGGVAMTDAAVPVPSAKVTAQGITAHARTIPAEVPVAFVYDGTTHAVMMASPTDLEDFAVGFSLAEGHHRAPEDMQSLDIVEQDKGIELRAWLVPDRGRKLAQRRRNLAGPTGCGLCGVESLEPPCRPAHTSRRTRPLPPDDIAPRRPRWSGRRC
jgi:formylmethanofuran dehydrogenase subunit D